MAGTDLPFEILIDAGCWSQQSSACIVQHQRIQMMLAAGDVFLGNFAVSLHVLKAWRICVAAVSVSYFYF